jgi:hypothetical protein
MRLFKVCVEGVKPFFRVAKTLEHFGWNGFGDPALPNIDEFDELLIMCPCVYLCKPSVVPE